MVSKLSFSATWLLFYISTELNEKRNRLTKVASCSYCYLKHRMDTALQPWTRK